MQRGCWLGVAGQGISLQRPSAYGITGNSPVPFFDVRHFPPTGRRHTLAPACSPVTHVMLPDGWCA